MIGTGTKTRIIVNVGITPSVTTLEDELSKAQAAVAAGADVVADHTITNEIDIEKFISNLTEKVQVPISTVPYYAAAVKAIKERGALVHIRPREILEIIEKQANLGTDMMTIHASLNSTLLNEIKYSKRVMKMTSRGGTWVAAYMAYKNCENPFLENFDAILDIFKTYGITMSLGPSLRTGSVADPLDDLVWQEIGIQEMLVSKALKRGVKTIVEYGGHIKIDQIPAFVREVKSKCHDIPLRPLITCTDVAAGWDHIGAAIAGTIAALNGADILTVITRAEHIGLPREQDVVEAVIAFKIAAHIADIAKLGSTKEDAMISNARDKCEWNSMWGHSIDPIGAERLYKSLMRDNIESDHCTMCGELCAHKIFQDFMRYKDK